MWTWLQRRMTLKLNRNSYVDLAVRRITLKLNRNSYVDLAVTADDPVITIEIVMWT